MYNASVMTNQTNNYQFA